MLAALARGPVKRVGILVCEGFAGARPSCFMGVVLEGASECIIKLIIKRIRED